MPAASLKIDLGGYAQTIDGSGDAARQAEQAGYDGWWAVESQLDPFLASAVAAERTTKPEIGTGIAVAFARNPMSVALQANDLQLLSEGRFILGLGTQIKPHVTKRFSMPYSKPAARMREFVLAIRAIWQAFATGDALDFRGDFYSHTLLTPFFSPGANPQGNPPIYVAAVGPLMTEVAGEVADGILLHSFTTERYIQEVTLPAIERGRARAGKPPEGFGISALQTLVIGDSEQQRTERARASRQQIAFYGSTPAYRPVLDVHGWGELQHELTPMSKRGEWEQMADVIDDEVFNAFALVGTLDEVSAELRRRREGLVTRVTVDASSQDPDDLAPIAQALRGDWARPVSAPARGPPGGPSPR